MARGKRTNRPGGRAHALPGRPETDYHPRWFSGVHPRNSGQATHEWKDFVMRCLWAMLFVLASPAGAAEVGSCGALDRISYLVGQTKTYSGGKITIAHIDTDGEPTCCSEHLLVLIPSPEIGSQCFAVSQKAVKDPGGARGFNSIAFNQIKTSYDPHRGLLLNVPYTLYNPDGGPGTPGSTNVRVDLRDKGSVRIEP